MWCAHLFLQVVFGTYAKALQNQKTPLEVWLASTSNWQHLWSESIVSFDHGSASKANEPSTAMPGVPADLSKMVENNAKTLHNMKSQFGQVMAAWNMQGPNGSGKGGGRRGGQRFGRRGGKGGDNQKGGKEQSGGGAALGDGSGQHQGGKRVATAGGAAFAKRARRGGAAGHQ